MQIKLYLDEDAMDADLANALRLRGVDVLTALEAGMIEKPDGDHLKFATRCKIGSCTRSTLAILLRCTGSFWRMDEITRELSSASSSVTRSANRCGVCSGLLRVGRRMR
jgi:hypothetical protein